MTSKKKRGIMGIRNVLLVTIDSLRYDRVLALEGAEQRAPTINRIAEDFATFEEAIANGPNTPSSFPTILTSTHPLMYGGYRYLDEQRPFISQTLRSSGFQTVGYHSNPHLGPDMNYDYGFDTFNDGGDSDSEARSIKNIVDKYIDPDSILYRALRRGYHLFQMTADTSAYERAPGITSRATDWFDNSRDGDRPFFMWLHYMDVHYPFTPPDEYLEKQGNDPLSTRRKAKLNGMMQENPEELTESDVDDLLSLYDGEIRFVDEMIQRVLDSLRQQNVLDETAVVITADHGEAFGEHGRFGHHPRPYDELVHVPLVVRAPGLKSVRVGSQVSLIDLGPTIYDLLDIDIPETVQGTSRVPLLTEAEPTKEDSQNETPIEVTTLESALDAPDIALCTSLSGEILACRTDRWKCLWQIKNEVIELYDLHDDPKETRDVSDQHDAVVQRFRDLMKEYLEEADATDVALPDVEDDPEVKQRLKDLGYVD